jgi:hypothetical protein
MENESEMQIETNILIPPPPTPCSARARINHIIVSAVPHNRLPRKKTVIASNNSGFRPQMSLSFAHIGAVIAVASTYAEPIHA